MWVIKEKRSSAQKGSQREYQFKGGLIGFMWHITKNALIMFMHACINVISKRIMASSRETKQMEEHHT